MAPSKARPILLRVSVLVGLVAAQGLIMTGAAHAESTSVRVERGELIVEADAGVANQIRISDSGHAIDITDVVSLTSDTSCERITATQLSCPADLIDSVRVELGDRDDQLFYFVSKPAVVQGGEGDDTIVCLEGPQQLNGGGGDDELYAGGGADKLQGGNGADDLFGEAGDDELSGGGDGDTVLGGVGSDVVSGGPGADVLYGDNTSAAPQCNTLPADGPGCSDTLLGGDDPDQLHGGEWSDELGGEAGDDTLTDLSGATFFTGGLGNDKITGGGEGIDMRDMVIYSERDNGVLVNLSDHADATMEAHVGGELGTDERDEITDVDDARGGAGIDTLIGNGLGNLIEGGPAADTCDADGNDGLVLTLEACTDFAP
jgi:Ca2+-binding RTX toxin-like protein